jgi:protein-S-isoprenylcysteine O-methyltransferase Ste14
MAERLALSAGGWFFRNRSWLPLPWIVVLLSVRGNPMDRAWLRLLGPSLITLGEATRLWSIRHIGVISRTRARRFGPLVNTGPYFVTRNPLYLGNLLLWAGFLLGAGLLWLAPVALLYFSVQHGFVTLWEEQQLAGHFGRSYRDYCRGTPRWLVRGRRLAEAWRQPARYAWAHVVFSERGTLLAIVLLGALVALRFK